MRSESHSYASVSLYAKAEEEGKKPRGASAFRLSKSLSELDLDGCIKETADKTISHLNYEKIINYIHFRLDGFYITTK